MWCTSNGLVHVHCYDFTILRLQSICLIFPPRSQVRLEARKRANYIDILLNSLTRGIVFILSVKMRAFYWFYWILAKLAIRILRVKWRQKNFLLKFYVKEENVHKFKSSWVVSRNIQGNGLYTGGNYTGGNYRQLLTIRCKLGTVLPILFSLYITGSRCRLELLPQNIKMHISRSSLPSGKILSATCEQV